MNFSWAMELDPKGINNQIKEAIDKRYATDEDESQIDDSGRFEILNGCKWMPYSWFPLSTLISNHWFIYES